MKYIRDPVKLARIIIILSKHKAEVEQYYLAQLQPRLAGVKKVQDKLHILFILANADRQSTGKDNKSLKIATATFRKVLAGELITQCKSRQPKDAHKHFLSQLCDIQGMDQKTANLFLKYLYMFQNELNLGLLNWQAWEHYLHVPLDLWVLRLIGKEYLDIGTAQYETDFKGERDYVGRLYRDSRYKELQEEISKAASRVNISAITLDILWFVGNKYCANHPLLCDICWLREECSRQESIDWAQIPIISKKHKYESQKEYNRKMRHVLRQLENKWLLENPDKTAEDFYQFLQGSDSKQYIQESLKGE